MSTGPFSKRKAMEQRLRSRTKSYLPVMSEGAFICGLTAGVLRGYPVDPGPDLDVATISPRRSPRARGVKGRRIAAHLVEVEVLDGIPITSAATTWTMLAKDLDVRSLIAVADAIVQIPRDSSGRQHPEQVQSTIDELRMAVAAGNHVGLRKLRAALERVRVGSSSKLETEYRLDAEDAGLPTPQLDVEIRDERGRLLGISEFVYPEFKVIVEIEGDQHRTSKTQWNRDLQKYRDYANAGWEVVRLTARDIRWTRTATHIVGTVLRRRGWNPAR